MKPIYNKTVAPKSEIIVVIPHEVNDSGHTILGFEHLINKKG